MKILTYHLKFIFLLIFTILTLNKNSLANPQNNEDLSLTLQNANIQDTLHFLATYLKKNIIISPTIKGKTSLRLHHLSKRDAFHVLLTSHNLKIKKLGNTSFILTNEEYIQWQQNELKLRTTLDESSPLITDVIQIQYAKAEDIARLVQENNSSLLSKRGQLRVDSRTNSLCIQEIGERLFDIKRIIKRLDVPVHQIVIEARLMSIDSDCERELGIKFAIKELPGSKPKSNSIALLRSYSLAVAKLADGAQLDVQLAALEKMGKGELISSPCLFTANQQTASIESGEEIPYQEVSQSGGTAISFKKAVLSLKVTPQVMPANTVLLQLQVNQDRPSNRVVLGVPAINTRQISTNVLVKNGQTIVLGGIYESNHEYAEHRIPFLGEIPLVGWLFKQQNVKKNKRELLIFVTPKIIPMGQIYHGGSEV